MAYCTAAEIREYAGIGSDADDVLLGNLADRATALMDGYCRRALIASADTTRYFTVGRDTEGTRLWFGEVCAAVTTVTNGDSVEVSSSEYALIDRNKPPYIGIKILGSAGKAWTYTNDPEDAISVLGAWAWFDVGATPDDIKHTAIRLATWLYRQKDSSSDTDRPLLTDAGVTILPSQIPSDVKSALQQYVKRG